MTANHPSQVAEAIRLHKEGQQQASRDCLCRFLLDQPSHIEALLWLARVTPDAHEAVAAAELALKLDPQNDVAQRAVVTVRERVGEIPEKALEKESLAGAIALATGMSLTQARSVRWPFRGIMRPLGEALDDGTITLRDLGWAVESVGETRIRDAARTVLLSELLSVEPKELPKLPTIIQGSRYAEWQERWSLLRLGMLLGAAMMGWAVGMILLTITTICRYVYGVPQPCWAQLGILAILGLVWGIVGLSRRFDDQADQYRQGRHGEDRAADELRYHLDRRWTIVRNLEWPNRRWGDVDLILVGPGGVWAFEVKAYSGRIRNTGDRWERRKKRRWRGLTVHPGKQVRRNAANARQYLAAHHVSLKWVSAAVLWAGESDNLILDDPATPVWTLDSIADHVEDLWTKNSLDDDEVRQVVEVLSGAIEIEKGGA